MYEEHNHDHPVVGHVVPWDHYAYHLRNDLKEEGAHEIPFSTVFVRQVWQKHGADGKAAEECHANGTDRKMRGTHQIKFGNPVI